MKFRKRKKIQFVFIARDLSVELLTREKTADQGKLDAEKSRDTFLGFFATYRKI